MVVYGCYNGGYGKWSSGRGGGGGGCYSFLCSCFIIILMHSLYYLNDMVKNIEVLMFGVSYSVVV